MLITIIIPTTLALGAIGDYVHWQGGGREGRKEEGREGGRKGRLATSRMATSV